MRMRSKTARAAAPRARAGRFVGSGNVFADLRLPDAGDRLLKAKLLVEIERLIRVSGWTQTEAAERLGIDQPKMSRLLAGRVEGCSAERLMRFLAALGRDVDIRIRRAPGRRAEGRVRVLAA
jgi:predicted XRE-type DNA-binding protein